uniref:Uncharacterized protein n=1 Tax=Arundo donax TaxID=35708 RepID=A0A0A9HHI4_ARUDO
MIYCSSSIQMRITSQQACGIYSNSRAIMKNLVCPMRCG